jgi:hypothetical protein
MNDMSFSLPGLRRSLRPSLGRTAAALVAAAVSLSPFAATAAPPPPMIELLSGPDEDAFGPRIATGKAEVLYEALTPDGRFIRRVGPKKKPLSVPPAELTGRTPLFVGQKRLLANALTAEGRWAVQVDGKEPASASSASDLQAAVSPDGRWVAFVSGRSGSGDLYLTPADKVNSPPRRLSEGALAELSPAWSPDSSALAFVRVTPLGRTLVVVRGFIGGATATETVVVEERVGPLAASFRPDGQKLGFYARSWSSETTLYTVSATGGPSLPAVKGVIPQAGGPAWLPGKTGAWLAATRTNDTIVLVDPTGKLVTAETGAFGHAEVAAGYLGKDRVLVFTAAGLTSPPLPAPGAPAEPRGYGRLGLYRWTVPASID